MSRLLVLTAALWAVVHPGLASAKDWEFYGGVRLGWGAAGFLDHYSGTFTTRTTELGPGPNQNPPGLVSPDVSGRPWQSGTGLHLVTGLRYHLLVVELAAGLDSVTGGGIRKTGRIEGTIGLRAPEGWHLGYESRLFSAFPSLLLGAGWGELKISGDDTTYWTRSGPCALASVRYDLRLAWFFVRPELQFRAMFGKKQDWADEGDSGGVEYSFDGVGYAWDLTGMVTVGVVFGLP